MPRVAAGDAPPVGAAGGASLEAEIRAAFLYHFGRYVEWPAGTFADPDEPVRIGVSDDAVAIPLAEITRTRTIRNRPVEVRRVVTGAEASRVHVLYIAAHTRPETAVELFRTTVGRPVLVVVDQDVPHPATIRFIFDRNRIRFDVSLTEATGRGLRLSARLLSVARRVEGGVP